MARIALWMEGAHHPFDEIRRWMMDCLTSLRYEVFSADIHELLGGSPPESDLWILGGLVYSGMGDSYRGLSDQEAARLTERVVRQQPLLSIHSVLGSWDERPELDAVWDGRWDWRSSRHSPVEDFCVNPSGVSHPITEGISSFTVTDELYYNLTNPIKSQVLLHADYEGQEWPLAWTSGNHAYLGLGHDLRSWQNAGTQALLANAVKWLTRESA